MDKQDYSIRIAHYAFTCPIAGVKVRKGDEYVETGGVAISLKAAFPERRLRKLIHSN